MADLWIETVADQWIEVRTDSWIEVTRLFRPSRDPPFTSVEALHIV